MREERWSDKEELFDWVEGVNDTLREFTEAETIEVILNKTRTESEGRQAKNVFQLLSSTAKTRTLNENMVRWLRTIEIT
jgi:hypothetical protein